MNKLTTKQAVLRMKGSEGLIVDGTDNLTDKILQMMKDEEIINTLNAFNTIYSFEDMGENKLLFMFDDIKDKKAINIAKMCVWRLLTKPVINGTWLSDYIDNENLWED